MTQVTQSDDSVLFIDASRAFASGTNQNTLEPANLDTIMQTFDARTSVDKYAYRATRAENVHRASIQFTPNRVAME